MLRKVGLSLAALLICAALAGCNTGAGDPPDETTLAVCREDALRLVQDLGGENFESAAQNHTYTPLMKRSAGSAALEQIWRSLTDQYGAFREAYRTDSVLHSGNQHSVIVGIAFDAQCIDLKVTYDGKTISGLHYSVNSDDPAAPTEQFLSAYPTREITFGEVGWELTGTLTLPDGSGGPWPVVVIVHGSGPLDRDGRVMRQTPYRDIAEGLAARGVATFRYDKRTHVYADRMTGDITVWEETIRDAAAAAVMLRSEAECSRLVMIGHSLGATLLPRIAGDACADGYIALAAAATPLHRLMVRQYEYLFGLDGALDSQEEAALARVRAMADNVDALEQGRTFKTADLFGIPASYWLDLSQYDTVQEMAALNAPLLMLQGEGDYQVPPAEFERFRAALSGRTDVAFVSYPGLSHLFTQAGDPPSPDDYAREGSFDGRALDDIAAWIASLR